MFYVIVRPNGNEIKRSWAEQTRVAWELAYIFDRRLRRIIGPMFMRSGKTVSFSAELDSLISRSKRLGYRCRVGRVAGKKIVRGGAR